jgi:hypothetical protein
MFNLLSVFYFFCFRIPKLPIIILSLINGITGLGLKMFVNSLLSIVILLLSPLIVLSNTLIISVWLRFKRLRTPSNALIISLAVADLGFGLFLPAAVALELGLEPTNSASSSGM